MTVMGKRRRFNEGGEGTEIAFVPDPRTSLFRRDPLRWGCVLVALVKLKIPRAVIGLPGPKSAEHAEFSFRSRTQIPRATKFSLVCGAKMFNLL